MKISTIQKLQILNKARKIFQNWYLYPKIYFKLTNQEHVTFNTKNGTGIKIRVNSTDLMALTNVWILEEYFKTNFEIKNDDVIVDVGGHIGLFSLYASQFCKKGKIFCFEPIKENFDVLKTNIELNKITNIFAFNLAVTENTGFVTMQHSDDNAAHSMYVTNSNTVQVPSISLEDIFEKNNIEKCDFLKLDCEGAEYDILESLSSKYFKKISKIVLEYHFANSKPELVKSMINKLKSESFKITTSKHYDDMGMLYAMK